jgi:hypothetical protein
MGHSRIMTTERYLHARPAGELADRFTRVLVGPVQRQLSQAAWRTGSYAYCSCSLASALSSTNSPRSMPSPGPSPARLPRSRLRTTLANRGDRDQARSRPEDRGDNSGSDGGRARTLHTMRSRSGGGRRRAPIDREMRLADRRLAKLQIHKGWPITVAGVLRGQLGRRLVEEQPTEMIVEQLMSSYFAGATSAAAGYQRASAVPERFTGTSRPVAGQSLVPPEYQGTSAPPIARTGLIEAGPGRSPAPRHDDAVPPPAEAGGVIGVDAVAGERA